MIKDDIVFCINNSNESMYHETINDTNLTMNKGYKVIRNYSYKAINRYLTRKYKYNTISIINDDGIMADYRTERFITIQQWRDKQLKNLLT